MNFLTIIFVFFLFIWSANVAKSQKVVSRQAYYINHAIITNLYFCKKLLPFSQLAQQPLNHLK
jgi:hypothetical protein